MKNLLIRRMAVLVALSIAPWGCMDLAEFVPYCPPGAEGCLCNDDGICDDGLSCFEDLCEPVTTEDDDVAVLTNQDCAYNTCDVQASCDTSGAIHVCVCNPGWTGNGYTCANIDECFEQTDHCDHVNGSCSDNDGSFACVCNAGWELNENGRSCENIDECASEVDNCDPVSGTCADNDGAFTCGCNAGWVLNADGHTCDNIDECASGTDDCHLNYGTCADIDGSFICECALGWSGDRCDIGLRYVRADGGLDSNSGSSWSDAFETIQAGIDAAAGGAAAEVWVARGTYYPTESDGSTADRESTVLLEPNVTVLGGFNGDELQRDERDPNPRTNGTVLSGDIDGDGLLDTGNVYHVVTGVTDATIDGFTITKGYANGSAEQRLGGGVFADGDVTVRNCWIIENFGEHGGGAHDDYSSPTYSNCIFEANTTSGNGGGLDTWNSNTWVINSVFIDNTATLGGGILDNQSSTTLINCTFHGNRANTRGGGHYTYAGSHLTVFNSIFWGNSAPTYHEIYTSVGTTATLSYSNVEGGYPGVGNMGGLPADNPLFVDAAGGDLRLSTGSPCINTGSNAALPAGTDEDLLGNSRINDGTVDMGAFEF